MSSFKFLIGTFFFKKKKLILALACKIKGLKELVQNDIFHVTRDLYSKEHIINIILGMQK